MKKWAIGIFIVSSILFMTPAEADDAQMKVTLAKIVENLQAIQPLITRAERQQSANPRYQVHFENWQSGDGVHHHGLRTDVTAIQTALEKIIQTPGNEPRVVTPIQTDFIGGQHD